MWWIISWIVFLAFQTANTTKLKIGIINDIHYEPYYEEGSPTWRYCRKEDSPLSWHVMIEKQASTFGQFGWDSPIRLVNLMFDKMNELEPDVDIILVTGDMISHGVSVELADREHHHQYELLKNLLEELIVNVLAKKFPNAYILPTIGNNDIKYHYVAPQKNFTAPDYYPYLYRLIFERIPKNTNLNLTGVKDTFSSFGGYKIDFSDDLSFISFNSLYYNNRTPSNDTEIKVEQLDWFEKTLDNAEPGRKFVIFFHIYPGMYFIGHVRFFWERPAVLRFNDILQRNVDKIALINGAHSHFPDIKVGFSSEFSVPLLMNTDNHFLKYIPKWTMLITPSISPVFRNNPGITLLELENNVPKNIVWHFMELYKFPNNESQATFNSLRFKEDLGIDEFTPTSALKFIKTIIGDRYQFYKFLAHKIGYRGKSMAHALAEYQDLKMINLDGEFDYFCSLLNMLRTDYAYWVKSSKEHISRDADWYKGGLSLLSADEPVGKPRVIFLIGGPGSGKSSLSNRIIANFDYVHLSTGELLREEVKKGGELAERLLEIMKQGKLVSSVLLIELVKKAMMERGWEKKRFLIDGFPRNLENAYEWNRQIGDEVYIDFILYMEVDSPTLYKRLLQRALISGRADDNEETIKKRLETFEKETLPVIKEFEKKGKVKKIDATKTKDQIYEEVTKLLS